MDEPADLTRTAPSSSGCARPSRPIALHRQAAESGRRRTDPQGDDHMHERGSNGIEVGYKGIRAHVTGPLALPTAMVLALGGGAIYVNYVGFQDMKVLLRQANADHDLLACVVSLTAEDRAQLRHAPSRRDIRDWFCPWLRVNP
jgi:hypothetical protein